MEDNILYVDKITEISDFEKTTYENCVVTAKTPSNMINEIMCNENVQKVCFLFPNELKFHNLVKLNNNIEIILFLKKDSEDYGRLLASSKNLENPVTLWIENEKVSDDYTNEVYRAVNNLKVNSNFKIIEKYYYRSKLEKKIVENNEQSIKNQKIKMNNDDAISNLAQIININAKIHVYQPHITNMEILCDYQIKYNKETFIIELELENIIEEFTNNKQIDLYVDEQFVSRGFFNQNNRSLQYQIQLTKLDLTKKNQKLSLRCGNIPMILRFNKELNNRYPINLLHVNYNMQEVVMRTGIRSNQIFITSIKKQDLNYKNFVTVQNRYKKMKTKQKYIIFYEKLCDQAHENSYQIFKEYYQDNPDYCFILKATNEKFYQLKELYGEQLVAYGSDHYFEVIFNAKMLVSSEMPSHLVGEEVIAYQYRDYLFSIPLVFLQHGISYLKSVESPTMNSFWKNSLANVIKVVVSSQAEAKLFKNVGYSDEDLIVSGLASFDNIETGKKKEKFVYAPTYRLWEMNQIENNKLKETSLYQDILDIISLFEKLEMDDDLRIILHPKNRKIKAEFPHNQQNMFVDYDDIKDEIAIMISDISSILLDAQYRGSYPIYYWNLIDKFTKELSYRMPIDLKTTNAPIAKDLLALEYQIKFAKQRKYILPEWMQENFQRICEFNDGNNTMRIQDELEKLCNRNEKND